MRLFTGLALTQEVIDNLTTLIDHLRPSAQIKWSAAYNLHITTRFIGEVPEPRLPEIIDVLRSQPPIGSIDIEVREIGWFPNPHSPRVLWTGVKAGENLAALARQTEQAIVSLGYPAESKPFRPHLTLARIKDAVPFAPLRHAIAELKSVEFGRFTATEHHLYLSKPGPSGSIYTSLADFPLLPQ
jgi:2'-5' RNA ligase